jgi:hypothetical protein
MALDEFNEEELFSADEQEQDEAPSDGSAEDVEQQDRKQSFPEAKQQGVDITGDLMISSAAFTCPPGKAVVCLASIVALTCLPTHAFATPVLDAYAGASSASHQSSILHASLDDELGSSLPPASPPMDVPALSSRRAAQLSSSVHPARGNQQYPRLVS